MNSIVFIFVICFTFSGCGFATSGLNLFRSGNAPPQVLEEQRQIFEKASRLIGKTKENVINEFGPHMRFSKKRILALNEYMPGYNDLHPLLERNLIEKSGINNYYKVDETAYYKYDAGIPIIMPNEYGVYFYFIDDVCVYVSGS